MLEAVHAAVLWHRPVGIHHDQSGRRVRLVWTSARPGLQLAWMLEVEQGANGVLAHLTAEPVAGPLIRLALRWRRLAVQPLSTHELRQLAELVLDHECSHHHRGPSSAVQDSRQRTRDAAA